MSRPLDIMSEAEGLVGAETFAAVAPTNDRRLANDLTKRTSRLDKHRYVSFVSRLFPGAKRLPKFELDGIEVWSIGV